MSKTQLAGIPVRALDASRGGGVGRSIIAAVMMALVVTWVAPASAQQADLNAPDLVVLNGKILTMDDRSEEHTSELQSLV